jgi:hypothetical protein
MQILIVFRCEHRILVVLMMFFFFAENATLIVLAWNKKQGTTINPGGPRPTKHGIDKVSPPPSSWELRFPPLKSPIRNNHFAPLQHTRGERTDAWTTLPKRKHTLFLLFRFCCCRTPEDRFDFRQSGSSCFGMTCIPWGCSMFWKVHGISLGLLVGKCRLRR